MKTLPPAQAQPNLYILVLVFTFLPLLFTIYIPFCHILFFLYIVSSTCKFVFISLCHLFSLALNHICHMAHISSHAHSIEIQIMFNVFENSSVDHSNINILIIDRTFTYIFRFVYITLLKTLDNTWTPYDQANTVSP